MFVDGTVRGASGEPNVVDFIKVNDTDSDSNAVSNDTLSDYVGDVLTVELLVSSQIL